MRWPAERYGQREEPYASESAPRLRRARFTTVSSESTSFLSEARRPRMPSLLSTPSRLTTFRIVASAFRSSGLLSLLCCWERPPLLCCWERPPFSSFAGAACVQGSVVQGSGGS